MVKTDILCEGPYYFMSCTLLREDGRPASENVNTSLAGTLVSSLHRLKDTDNEEGGFFVFGDLSVKLEGKFALQFNLYEMAVPTVSLLKSITSEPFTVHAHKNFPGMSESTFLTRSFSDQGVRLRLRKEPRKLLRKRGPASDDYEPRHYNTARRQSQNESGPSSIPGSMQSSINSKTPDSFSRFDQSRPRSVMMQEPSPVRPIGSGVPSDQPQIFQQHRGSEHSMSTGSDVSGDTSHIIKRQRMSSGSETDPTQASTYFTQQTPMPPQAVSNFSARSFTDQYAYQAPQHPQHQMYNTSAFATPAAPQSDRNMYGFTPSHRDGPSSIPQAPTFDPMRSVQISPVSPLSSRHRYQTSPQYNVIGDSQQPPRQGIYSTQQGQGQQSQNYYALAPSLPQGYQQQVAPVPRTTDEGVAGDVAWRGH